MNTNPTEAYINLWDGRRITIQLVSDNDRDGITSITSNWRAYLAGDGNSPQQVNIGCGSGIIAVRFADISEITYPCGCRQRYGWIHPDCDYCAGTGIAPWH